MEKSLFSKVVCKSNNQKWIARISPRKENVEVRSRVLLTPGDGVGGATWLFSENRFAHTPSVVSVGYGTWKSQGILVVIDIWLEMIWVCVISWKN